MQNAASVTARSYVLSSDVRDPSADDRLAPRAITVRAATVDDAEAITGVHVASWQVAYRGQLPDAMLDGLTDEIPARSQWRRDQLARPAEHQRTFVAQRGSDLVGFVALGPVRDDPAPDRGEVYAIYVAPPAWGTGAGRALMERATAELVDLGFRDAVLWVLASNDRARRFYERCGWTADGGEKREQRGDVVLDEVRYGRPL